MLAGPYPRVPRQGVTIRNLRPRLVVMRRREPGIPPPGLRQGVTLAQPGRLSPQPFPFVGNPDVQPRNSAGRCGLIEGDRGDQTRRNASSIVRVYSLSGVVGSCRDRSVSMALMIARPAKLEFGYPPKEGVRAPNYSRGGASLIARNSSSISAHFCMSAMRSGQ